MPADMLEFETALLVLRMRGTVRITFGAIGAGGGVCELTHQPYLPNAPVREQINADTVRVRGTFDEVMDAIMRAVS